MSFGNRLRIAIEQHHKMSLTEFSKKSGFTLQNISHFLSGQRKPGLDSLVAMLKALPDTNSAWLITGSVRDE